jgi:long-subunit acyl-CoA synthetase (AMP-forming)
MLSHENIVSNVMMGKVGEGGNLSWKGGKDNQGDKILAFLPFFHIYVSHTPSSIQIRSQK